MMKKLLLKVGGIVLTAAIIVGMIQTVPKMINYSTEKTGDVTTILSGLTADAGEKSVAMAQKKIDAMTNAFQVPNWVNNILENSGVPEMTDEDTFAGFFFENSLPGEVQSFLNENVFNQEAIEELEETYLK